MSVRAACEECGSRKTRTIETRAGQDGTTVRRRICMECGHKFATCERVYERRPRRAAAQ